MSEYLIAKGVIHSFINKKKVFKMSELKKSIIGHGGIMRIAPCFTITDYLREFEKDGKIIMREAEDDYTITVIDSD